MNESRRDLIARELRKHEREKYSTTYFAEEYWKEDLPGQTGNRGLTYDDPDHLERFSFLRGIIARWFFPQRWLDAGTGLGSLLDGVEGEVMGFDAAWCGAKQAAQRHPGRVWVGGVEAIPLKNDVVDLVTCFDVLEHVPVLDIEAATRELVRVSSRWVVATINLDNPYRFHPTILSAGSWRALFALAGASECRDVVGELGGVIAKRYPEYDLFVFEKTGAGSKQ